MRPLTRVISVTVAITIDHTMISSMRYDTDIHESMSLHLARFKFMDYVFTIWLYIVVIVVVITHDA